MGGSNSPDAGVRDQAEGPGTLASEDIRVTQPELLLGGGSTRAALYGRWSRQKRRNALEQRYGEDFPGLGDELGDLFDDR